MCEAIDIMIILKSNGSEVAIMLLQNVGCVNLDGSNAKKVRRFIMHAILVARKLHITWK
jgi:hypothetical protein